MSTMTKVTDLTASIHRLYQFIDALDFSAMVALFTDRAIYQRPGYNSITGRDGIEHFYRQERVIDHGEHTLDLVLTNGENIVVRGRFCGALKSGGRAEHQFAEFFTVTPEGLIASRTTFFFAPLV